MASITYGWGDVIKKKQVMGYAWCPTCRKFELRYVSKLRFRIHISYIPIFIWPKGEIVSCKGCKCFNKISKDEFKNLKAMFKPITKSMAKKCFNDILEICHPIMQYSPAVVEDVMMQISQKYPVCLNEELKAFYSQLITDVICSKLESMNVQLENSQNPAIESMA